MHGAPGSALHTQSLIVLRHRLMSSSRDARGDGVSPSVVPHRRPRDTPPNGSVKRASWRIT